VDRTVQAENISPT